MTKKTNKQEYNASSIKTLSQRTHLLKRMSLTFGSETGDKDLPFSSQKTVAIREIIDNSVDEVLGGYGNQITVNFFKDNSVEIIDNGRGLPVDIGKDGEGNPANGIYLTLGLIQSGGKFELSNRYSAGLNGVGAASTINVSKRADITVYRDNNVYKLSFKDGQPGFFAVDNDPNSKFTPSKDLTELKVEKDKRPAADKKLFKTGTTVKVWLDDSSFASKYGVNRQDIIERLRGTAFLIPKINIDIYNEVDLVENLDGNQVPQVENFHFTDGIEELVLLNQNKDPIAPTIHLNVEAPYIENVGVLQADGVSVQYQDVDRVAQVELVVSYDSSFDYHMESYVNTIRTRLGGVHEDAFEKALVSAFNDKIVTMRGLVPKGTDKPIIDDYREGLSVVISAMINEPQFTGQSKEKLGGREVQRAIQKALVEALGDWAQAGKNFESMKVIGQKVSDAAKARQAQREERDLSRKKASLERSNDLPEKLVDCEITHEDDSELYIAEGDSAMGSLKASRHSKYQALLPIRGKIINANKETLKKVLDNKEVQDIIKCLDAGVGSDFNTDRLRYGRVFIAADADSDGGAISCLLLVLFWQLFRPLVLEGRLYQLQTPLFVVKPAGKNSERIYAKNDQELARILKKLDNSNTKYVINRIKGLGEASKEVMNETGMNPRTRIVKRITVGDIESAQHMLDVALGKDVVPRKEWIESNPIHLEGLD